MYHQVVPFRGLKYNFPSSPPIKFGSLFHTKKRNWNC